MTIEIKNPLYNVERVYFFIRFSKEESLMP